MCLFLAKNSLTEISRCLDAIDWADACARSDFDRAGGSVPDGAESSRASPFLPRPPAGPRRAPFVRPPAVPLSRVDFFAGDLRVPLPDDFPDVEDFPDVPRAAVCSVSGGNRGSVSGSCAALRRLRAVFAFVVEALLPGLAIRPPVRLYDENGLNLP
jgi:hypothetical protein